MMSSQSASKLWEVFPLRNGRRSGSKYIYVLAATSLFVLFATVYTYRYSSFSTRDINPVGKGAFEGVWSFTRDAQNLKLNDAQCDAAFPGLFKEIDRAVKSRKNKHVTTKEMDEVPNVRGFVRAMIYDQKLYMLAAADGVNSRNQATLLALHRAILTSPNPLPNIEFTLNADDIAPDHTTWAYARKEEMEKIWVMPDFGYWSWPEPKIGSYSEVQMKATRMDQKVQWKDKTNKAVWRGAMMDLKVREDLLKASEGKSWSDIKRLSWQDDASGATHDSLTMDQHCRYKYVVHTEGVSYSARLQNLQNCRSVLVSHKLSWIQHHSHLMKSSGPQQNFVQVEKDFSNLDEVMEGLMKKDGKGGLETIANNSVKVFRERYLSPAAETCYWRKLIRGWARVSPEPKFWRTGEDGEDVWRGLPIESYLLERRMDWDLH